MDKKRVLFQIRNCSPEEEEAIKSVINSIFPMSVIEGQDPILCGQVHSAEEVRGLVTDQKNEIISGLNISPKDLENAKQKSQFGGNKLLGAMMRKIDENDITDVVAEPVKH